MSSVYRDERDVPHHLAMGTYVVFEGETEYARRCFREYHLLPDTSGSYAALYRPTHMIGLELGISVASVALRSEPTGAPTGFRSDVVATAKRDLKAGEMLDGEGGFCVWGKQTPAQSRSTRLPAARARPWHALKRDIAKARAALGRCRLRRQRHGREISPRDGNRVRAAQRRLICRQMKNFWRRVRGRRPKKMQ